MAFRCAVLLLLFWFVRPQDVLPSLAGLNVVRYLMLLGIWAIVSRPGGLKVGHIVRTPIDCMMMGFLAWIVYTTPEHWDAFKEVFTYFAFYVLTVLALDSQEAIKKYITYWSYCLLAVCLLALASQFGMEIVAGSNALTTAFKGRVALNTWIFNNPNALGHASVALIPLAVAWYGMRQPALNRMLMAGLISAAAYCVLLTQSKGAYISGAVSLCALHMFRRPVWVQVVALQLLLTAGLGALSFLPRMETLSSKDQGIMGRMMVWQSAMWSLKMNPSGVGLKKFQGTIEVEELGTVNLATHGSFVRTGADLGYPGLFFFSGLFFTAYLTLRRQMFAPKTEAHYIQGALAVLMVSYGFSCWVIDRAYHADFILLMALFSAYHRVIVAPQEKPQEAPFKPTFATGANAVAAGTAAQVKPGESTPPMSEEGLVPGWGRPAFHQLLIIVCLVWLIVYAWDYQSTKFLPF
jgi:hypothetical protein